VNPAMAENTRGDVTADDDSPRARQKSTATRFFLRGVAISLPPILTVVILLWLAQGVHYYIIQPISLGVKFSIASVIDDSRELSVLKELSPPVSLLGCGTNYRISKAHFEELQERLQAEGKRVVDRSWLNKEHVYVVINTQQAIPYADHQLVVRNTSSGEMPRSARGMYMIVATVKHFQGQFLLSAFAILITVVLLYFLGRLVTNRLGAWGVRQFESTLVSRVPLVSNVYSSVKQVTDFLFTERTIEYNRIVAIEYPRRGIWSLGFVTGESLLEMTTVAGEPLVSILVPTSPMPVTGYTINVPKSEIVDLNVTIDQAFQFCISCGVLVPEHQAVTTESLQKALARRLTIGVDQPAVTRPTEAQTGVSPEEVAEDIDPKGEPV